MPYDTSGVDMDIVRRNFRIVAFAGLSIDLVISAVIWFSDVATVDIRTVIAAAFLSSGILMSFFLVKVVPDRVAKLRGLD